MISSQHLVNFYRCGLTCLSWIQNTEWDMGLKVMYNNVTLLFCLLLKLGLGNHLLLKVPASVITSPWAGISYLSLWTINTESGEARAVRPTLAWKEMPFPSSSLNWEPALALEWWNKEIQNIGAKGRFKLSNLTLCFTSQEMKVKNT